MKKYIPITEQPYCCVPACIQMLLLRRKLPLKSQEEIGHDLGLIVPQKYRALFRKVRTGKKPKSGWGTQTGKWIYSVNNFFKKSKINLKEEFFFLTKPKEIKEFLKENLAKKDIIACFNYQRLYNKAGDATGHVSIIESIEENYLTLIDPVYDVPKYRRVSLKKLAEAIQLHGKEKRAGFWVIS
ncbi:MAG: hypothetical protein AAB451_03885 [Patescibacteria group bacterium]